MLIHKQKYDRYDGTLLEDYTVDERGYRQGDTWVYYRDGVLKARHVYKDGLLEGLSEEYYSAQETNNPSGIKKQIFYSHGLPDGQFREFYPNGKLKREGRMKQGKMIGEVCEWYENGQLARCETYRAGRLSGISKVYDQTGHLVREIDYSHATGKAQKIGKHPQDTALKKCTEEWQHT